MSTLKADAVTAQSTNGDLVISGNGTGVPDIEAGFKVGSVAGVPTASIRDDAVTTAKIVDDAVTIAKIAAGTDGELITWDASGDPAVVAVGTATHILTSNGAGAAPTFQAAGGGGEWEFIETIDPTSVVTQDITLTGRGADEFKIVFHAVSRSGGYGTTIRYSTDGGSTYLGATSSLNYTTSSKMWTETAPAYQKGNGANWGNGLQICIPGASAVPDVFGELIVTGMSTDALRVTCRFYLYQGYGLPASGFYGGYYKGTFTDTTSGVDTINIGDILSSSNFNGDSSFHLYKRITS